MKTTSSTSLKLLVSTLVPIVLASCASEVDISRPSSAPLAQQIIEATAGATLAPTWYSSPLEATPLTTFVIDGVEQAEAVSDLFVVGTVDSVAEGMSYSWPTGPAEAGDDEAATVTHSFNHQDAWITTVHLNVLVESSLEKDVAHADLIEVAIGLALLNPVDMDSLTEELVGQRIAAPLHSNEKSFFGEESGVYGVLLGGEMLGFVNDDQVVSFPALRHLAPSTDGTHSYNLASLLNPPTRVSLQIVEGEYVNVDSPALN